MRIKTIYRKVFRVSLAAAVVSALLVAGSYIGVTFLVPDELIKKNITSFFIDNFNKAVIFDSVSVSPFGTVTIINFAMSKEADFNDNIDLVRCKEVRAGVSVGALLRKRIRIKSIYMDGAQIQLVKNSSTSYMDFIRRVIETKKKSPDLLENELRDMTLRLNNTKLTFKEVCVTDTATVTVKDFSLKLAIHNGALGFSGDGKIEKGKTSWIDKGSLSINGSCVLPKGQNPYSGLIHVTTQDFDLSSFSPQIRDISDSVSDVEGGFSSDIKLRCIEGSWSVVGKAGVESLTLTKRKNETEKETLVSDEQIRSSFVLEQIMGQKLVLRSFTLDNGIISVSCEGTRTKGLKSDSCEGALTVQAGEIRPVFEKYQMLKPYTMGGVLNVRAHIGFDLASGGDDIVDMIFSLSHIETDGIKKGDIVLTATRQELKTSVDIDGKDTDLKLNAVTGISKWGEFSSRTTVEASSKKVDGKRLGGLILSGITEIYSHAWDDRKRGYEDIRFLSTPLGKIIPSNDISVSYSCDTIAMGKSALKGGKIGITLSAGKLTTDRFELTGCGGTYHFSMEGLFNNDYPVFKAEASLDNVDLASALSESGIKGVSGSILSGAAAYSMNGNRASHIVENGTIDARLEVKNTVLSNDDTLNRFYAYFNANGIKAKPESLTIPRIALAYKQLNASGVFTEFGMSADLLSFSGYGKYDFSDGLKVAVPSAQFTSKNADGSIANETAPFSVTGRLMNPVLALDSKKVSGNLILYKID
jgi:hypothetical protein